MVCSSVNCVNVTSSTAVCIKVFIMTPLEIMPQCSAVDLVYHLFDVYVG